MPDFVIPKKIYMLKEIYYIVNDAEYIVRDSITVLLENQEKTTFALRNTLA
jgi:hypothetical protein